MAKHAYLPELSKDANISIPDKSGLWENKDRGIIAGISDAIIISEAEGARGISSVPDVWARPLMFQSAIKSGDTNPHPLRDRMVQEWRGLLSLLALAKIKKYPIEIVPVELGDDKFSSALISLAPKPVQLEKNKAYKWTDVLLIRYDKIAIGAFSPTTLIYTATDYCEKLRNKHLKVLTDGYGYLREPKGHLDLVEAVGKWLCHIEKTLKSEFYREKDNPDIGIVNNLLGLISNWLKDIRIQLGIDEGKNIESKSKTISKDSFEPLSKATREILKQHQIYQHLLFPIENVEGMETSYHSDMSLELEKGINRSQYKEVVIITESLLGQNNEIWTNIRLEDLGGDVQKCLETDFKDASGQKIGKEDISEKGAIWIRPEKYFLTDVLLKGKHGNFLMTGESEYNFGTKYVLPFKKEILDFFTPEHIKQILKPTFKEEHDGVRFTYYLPIVGGVTEKIEKFYKAKDVEIGEHNIQEVEVPIIEIFPNYLDKHWRRYYVFQSHVDNFQLLPIIIDDEKKKIYNRTHSVDLEESKQKVNISEITSDNAFPEGLEIRNPDDMEGMGLILIPKPQEPREPDKEWTIGIDFGTSNTNIFRQSSIAETAEQWSFDFQKHVRRISASDNEMRKELLEICFIPPKNIELPIPSTLRIFSLAQTNRLLLDYFIHFSSKYKIPENVYSDIKWDTESEKKTGYFIESLLLLILIEVSHQRIRKVNISCSYPKAFSETSITIFERDWTTTIKNLLSEKDCILKTYKEVDSEVGRLTLDGPFYEIEGIASGKFFGSEKTIPDIKNRAKVAIAAICLDVGGGTTDISIWHHNEIVADASVLLAGRQVAQLFQKNEQVRELLFSKEARIALAEKKNEPAVFAARLNSILKKEELSIQEMLLKHANQHDIQWLRKMLAIEFCAISFYTALLTIATDRIIGGSSESQGALLNRIATNEISLHWGGNAAKFINWIDFGEYDKNGIASKMLNAVYFQCLKDVEVKPKALSQLQSPGHKSEVSGGLVVIELDKLQKDFDKAERMLSEIDIDIDAEHNTAEGGAVGVICGENIELKDRQVNYWETITGRDFFNEQSITKFKSSSLDRLTRFVNIVNFFGIKFGLLKEDTKIRLSEENQRIIRDEVLSSFIEGQSIDEGKRVTEPIFIMEMRILLEILRNELS